MTVTLSITESDVFTALRAFLIAILPAGIEVVQGQENGVSEPLAGDFVIMTATLRRRLDTNLEDWDHTDTAPTTTTAMAATEVTMQCDVHGPASADNAQIITTLFRSAYSVQQFATSGLDITPLHVSDPRQVPFVNGEQQFENRWAIDMAMQANPIVTVPQDFANTLTIGLIEVDTFSVEVGELDFSDLAQSQTHPAI